MYPPLWRRLCHPRWLTAAVQTWMICVPVIIGIRELNRFTTGWMAYFRLADTGNLVREVDRWLCRLRQVRWKEWKTTARRHNPRRRGIPERNVRKWGR
jgi:hypothetical protein